jgi:rhodanese-related sulfurtransferase
LTGEFYKKERREAENKMTKPKVWILGILIVLMTAFFSIAAGSTPSQEHALMTAEKALREYRQNTLAIIDVRNRQDYENLHIPGSLNLPLYAVKAKPFLKTRPILLVNEGFAMTPLVTECHALKQKGFTAFVLSDGLLAWNAQKAPLQGNQWYLSNLSQVSANLFHQEKDRADLIIVDASTLSAAKKAQPVKSIGLKTLLASAKEQGRKPSSILVFNQDGAGYERIQNELEKAGIGPVFYLTGGMSEYTEFLKNLALSHRSMDERTESIRACPSCAHNKKKDEV